jgi:hypothetical protein
MAKDIKLAGVNFYKVSAEKNPEFKDKITIKPSINIANIEEYKPSKNDVCKVDFNFGINYGDLGKVALTGAVFLSMDGKTLKEILKSWKDKKLDNDTNVLILNVIMQKASLKALQLEEELGLPPHVALPRLQLGESKK